MFCFDLLTTVVFVPKCGTTLLSVIQSHTIFFPFRSIIKFRYLKNSIPQTNRKHFKPFINTQLKSIAAQRAFVSVVPEYFEFQFHFWFFSSHSFLVFAFKIRNFFFSPNKMSTSVTDSFFLLIFAKIFREIWNLYRF
jgi:hypothetical protein